SFRIASAAGASRWQTLRARFPYQGGPQDVPRGRSGRLEVRAERAPTWFVYVRPSRGYWTYDVPAERTVDTGIRVRPGDIFSVQVANLEPFYLLRSSGPQLLKHERGTAWTEHVDYTGTIRFK